MDPQVKKNLDDAWKRFLTRRAEIQELLITANLAENKAKQKLEIGVSVGTKKDTTNVVCLCDYFLFDKKSEIANAEYEIAFHKNDIQWVEDVIRIVGHSKFSIEFWEDVCVLHFSNGEDLTFKCDGLFSS